MLLALTLASALQLGAPADSLVGAWVLKGDVVGNPLNQTCTFRQVGAVLSGSCVNPGDGALPHELTGEAKEGKITFRHAEQYDGQTITIIYTVTAAAPAELKGTVEVLPFNANGTFTATPVPKAP